MDPLFCQDSCLAKTLGFRYELNIFMKIVWNRKTFSACKKETIIDLLHYERSDKLVIRSFVQGYAALPRNIALLSFASCTILIARAAFLYTNDRITRTNSSGLLLWRHFWIVSVAKDADHKLWAPIIATWHVTLWNCTTLHEQANSFKAFWCSAGCCKQQCNAHRIVKFTLHGCIAENMR